MRESHMTTVTRDPEVLPTSPGYLAIPWQPQPSIYEALEVAIIKPEGVRELTHVDIDKILATPRTHESFMASQRVQSRGVGESTHEEWVEWQKTRDPLNEDPEAAEKERARIEEERRGPGISRRPSKAAAKKTAAKKTKS